MKFYLSSYKIGNEGERLRQMAPKGKIGYIPNALDFLEAKPGRKKMHIEVDMEKLKAVGLLVELVDLREYFGKKGALKAKLQELGAIFVSGGNTFVLRQAMRLSGLEELLKEMKERGDDFLYSGYSAGGCVLSPSLRVYTIVDDPTQTPYEDLKETIWEGLGFIDFAFMPHWKSDHPESADVDKEIARCVQNGIPYKAIRDGEVIIIE